MFFSSCNPTTDIADVFINSRALDQGLSMLSPSCELFIVIVVTMRRTAPLTVMVSDGYGDDTDDHQCIALLSPMMRWVCPNEGPDRE
jgi:hypothetical protein